MKKLLLIAGFGFIMSSSLYAQSPVTQGSIMIDAGIGWPTGNILYNNGDGDGYKVKGGPFAYGGRFEYMIAEDFGIGIDGNFVKTGFSYDTTYTSYSVVTGQDSIVTDSYGLTNNRARIMIRLNKHIVQNDQMDAYIGAGVGYKMVNRTATTNGMDDAVQEGALIPLAVRLAFGVRFFFTENIGAHVELGAWGGAPVQFGLSIKL